MERQHASSLTAMAAQYIRAPTSGILNVIRPFVPTPEQLSSALLGWAETFYGVRQEACKYLDG